jgi:hypothetical protein
VTLTEAVRHWPTPRAADGDSGMEYFFRGPTNPTLLGAVRKWPTPTAGDGKSSGRTHAGTSLTDAVIHDGGHRPRAWPTPRAEDSETCGPHRGVPDSLSSAVKMWPTPSATPYGSSQNGINGIGGEHERPSARTPSLDTHAKKAGGQLNADWVEALQGFPIGWTDGPPVQAKSKKSGSRRVRSRRRPIRTEDAG